MPSEAVTRRDVGKSEVNLNHLLEVVIGGQKCVLEDEYHWGYFFLVS